MSRVSSFNLTNINPSRVFPKGAHIYLYDLTGKLLSWKFGDGVTEYYYLNELLPNLSLFEQIFYGNIAGNSSNFGYLVGDLQNKDIFKLNLTKYFQTSSSYSVGRLKEAKLNVGVRNSVGMAPKTSYITYTLDLLKYSTSVYGLLNEPAGNQYEFIPAKIELDNGDAYTPNGATVDGGFTSEELKDLIKFAIYFDNSTYTTCLIASTSNNVLSEIQELQFSGVELKGQESSGKIMSGDDYLTVLFSDRTVTTTSSNEKVLTFNNEEIIRNSDGAKALFEGEVFIPEWDSTVTYKTDSVVSLNTFNTNQIYRCVKDDVLNDRPNLSINENIYSGTFAPQPDIYTGSTNSRQELDGNGNVMYTFTVVDKNTQNLKVDYDEYTGDNLQVEILIRIRETPNDDYSTFKTEIGAAYLYGPLVYRSSNGKSYKFKIDLDNPTQDYTVSEFKTKNWQQLTLNTEECTYEDLKFKVTNSLLIPSQKYILSDYEMFWKYEDGETRKSVSPEGLILTSLTYNTFYDEATSVQIPTDRIIYEFSDAMVSTLESTTGDFVIPTKGVITKRISTDKNFDLIEGPFDFRNFWIWDSSSSYKMQFPLNGNSSIKGNMASRYSLERAIILPISLLDSTVDLGTSNTFPFPYIPKIIDDFKISITSSNINFGFADFVFVGLDTYIYNRTDQFSVFNCHGIAISPFIKNGFTDLTNVETNLKTYFSYGNQSGDYISQWPLTTFEGVNLKKLIVNLISGSYELKVHVTDIYTGTLTIL